MDLYKDILIGVLSKNAVKVKFENLEEQAPEILVEMKCYQALKHIREVLNNSSLSDFECIEEIVLVLEDIGSGGGSRHNF